MSSSLATDREALAHELAQQLQKQSFDIFLDIARTLVNADEAHLFGDTEFKIRDLLLRFGVQAYDTLLEQKKTVTTAPVSPVRSANKPPASTNIASANP